MIYRSICICFPSCACVLQNEHVSTVKSFQVWLLIQGVFGLVVGWSADRWSVDLAPFWCRDFAILILIFFVLTIKKKQIWLLEAITIPFLKIYKYFNFKRKKPRVYCNFIQYFFYLLEVATDVLKSTPCYRILLSELLHRYFL